MFVGHIAEISNEQLPTENDGRGHAEIDLFTHSPITSLDTVRSNVKHLDLCYSTYVTSIWTNEDKDKKYKNSEGMKRAWISMVMSSAE